MNKNAILCASIRNLPFRSETFTTLSDISTLDHISYVEAANVVSEYARVLNHDGILLLRIDSKFSFPWEMYRKLLLRFEA